MTDRTFGQPQTDVRHALGWAAFLGVSWTWVIGMFLPVLLIRDFGPPAWFVFAIPNVLGAAAMGWVIRSREHSVAFVENHRAAAQAFSLVTIAFHLYVILWIVPKLLGPIGAAVAFAAALVALSSLLTTTLRVTTLAIAVFIASVLIAVAMAGMGALHWPAPREFATLDLVALGVVCLLGFLTCPYLDLTFHRASQASRTPGESRIAFGVGFGGFFCSMIVFTLFYASVFYARPADVRVPLAMIGVHICLQAIFTVGAHAAAFGETTRSATPLIVTAAVPAVLALVVHGLESRGVNFRPLFAGEVVYRTFMAFYGLIAPAYVWICVRRADERPTPNAARIAAASALVAAPFFWVGFMHASMRWALPGVLALLVGWIVVAIARRNADMRDRAFRALGGHLKQ